VESLTVVDISKKLLANLIEPGLQRRKDAAHVALKHILEDKNAHPITYNHTYIRTVQDMRSKKYENTLAELAEEHKQEMISEHGYDTNIDVKTFLESLPAMRPENNMETFSAEDALLCQMAYYKVNILFIFSRIFTNIHKDESKYFVNCVTKQVIERCLIKELATDIVSAIKFGDMDDKQVSNLAREANDIMQERERLTRKKEMLEEGQEAFRKELGGF